MVLFKEDVVAPAVDEVKPLPGSAVIEPAVEVDPTTEVKPTPKTSGDLVVIPETGKTLPEAALEGLRDLLEWVKGKIVELLGIEPREALTPLIIIKVIIRVVSKSILTLGSAYLSFFGFIVPFLIYAAYFYNTLCQRLEVDAALALVFGWLAPYVILCCSFIVSICVGGSVLNFVF